MPHDCPAQPLRPALFSASQQITWLLNEATEAADCSRHTASAAAAQAARQPLCCTAPATRHVLHSAATLPHPQRISHRPRLALPFCPSSEPHTDHAIGNLLTSPTTQRLCVGTHSCDPTSHRTTPSHANTPPRYDTSSGRQTLLASRPCWFQAVTWAAAAALKAPPSMRRSRHGSTARGTPDTCCDRRRVTGPACR